MSHYEIGPLLGEGGMGEVYRARDLTLNRDVALKVIGGAGLDDPSALARFEREAHLLASLNHAHIASIFGFVDGGGVRAIVMELVEGQTLADRLAGGALPVRDALAVADQIAAAIEAAHEKGIVHRDLKPANIKFTAGGAVKVLDFGIAKAAGTAVASMDQVPTVEATNIGTILGTAAYMSPEQARGLAVDARTDIWAFGAILYEMLTGRRAFDGATGSDVVAAVLTRDPDWSALSAGVPAAAVRLLHRCLERDPGRRLRAIGAARYVLAEDPAPRAAGPAVRRTPVAWLALATFAAGAVLTFLVMRAITRAPVAAPAEVPPAILGMSEPPGESLYLFAGPIALSPDGRRVALVTNSADGKSHIWIRSLAVTKPEPLRADAGMSPFWSPDGRSLGFFSAGQLKVADLSSGAVVPLASWKSVNGGGTWSRNGVIVYSDGAVLMRVSAGGGPATTVVTADPSSHLYLFAPHFLPDGRHVLYYASTMSPTSAGSIMVASIDGGAPRQIMASASMAIYAPPGYLLYQRDGEIVAQRFDADTLSLNGEPTPLATGAWVWTTAGATAMSASDTGMVMFATRRSAPSRLTLFERSGKPVGTVGDVAEWVHVAVSPDGRSVAAERLDPRTGSGTIWTIDLARNASSRLTPEPTWSLAPIWSPDGRSIAYGASRQGVSDVFARSSDGVGPERAIDISPFLQVPTDWTRDGRLVLNRTGPSGADIVSLPSTGGQTTTMVATPANETMGKVSPDGHWLAYASNESGRTEVYIRGLDGHGRWPVSSNGGGQPRWRADGQELFFVSADANLMAARVKASGGQLAITTPELLPIKVQPDIIGARYVYDVLANGQRFVVNMPAGSDPTPPIIAIPNWPALVRR